MTNKNQITVLGGGESGVGAAILAKKKGFSVFLSDNNEIQEKYKSVLTNYEIDFEENGHSLSRILSAGQVVKSPGIPDYVPVIRSIIEKEIRK